MAPGKKSKTLLALTSAALGLPGIAGKAQADWLDDVGPLQTDYRYSAYREKKLSGSATGGTDGERYEVDSHQFHVARPFGELYDVDAALTYETMSGASPWFITPGPDGKPVQVLSAATIDDSRLDLLAKVNRKLEQHRIGISAGYSDEDDYQAVNVGVDGDWQQNEQRTFSAGLGYSDDELNPTDGASTRFPTRIAKATKASWAAFGGVTQVLDARTTVQASGSYGRNEGFLSDPYKLAFVNGNTVNDSRPDDREVFTAVAKLRRYFPDYRAAAHLDYRYYYDDWEIEAHTLEGAWYQRFGEHWRISPALRYYSQSQAFFYQPFYGAARSDGFHSSDYRLSPYGAISLRVGGDYEQDQWRISLSYETYDSGGDRAIKTVRIENPGIVDFDIVSLSLAYKF